MNNRFVNEECYDELAHIGESIYEIASPRGSINLSECSPEFMAEYVWESTPEEELQEAIAANKQVGEPIPQYLQEAYSKYLAGMTLSEAVSDIKRQYRPGDIVFVNPASNPIGFHRFLIIKKILSSDDITSYKGFVLSSNINNSNLRNMRYPDNIYVDKYDWMLKSGGYSRKPCYINTRELFTFKPTEFSDSGTYKGTVKPAFMEFIKQCQERVGTHDNQYWRWINGKAVNEKPSSDMTDKEYKEALKFW